MRRPTPATRLASFRRAPRAAPPPPPPDNPPPDNPPPDNPPPDNPPGPCQPGQSLGLCTLCGPDGAPVSAQDDPNCPPLDCESLDYYEASRDEGVFVCHKWVHRRPPSRCLAIETCRPAPDRLGCGEPTQVEVERAESECQSFEGCAGAERPTVVPAPAGTPCEGGICNPAGDCDDAPLDACGDFADGAHICGFGTHVDGNRYCELAQSGEADTCVGVCSARNGVCLLAWSNDACDRAEAQQVGCITPAPALTCRCATP